MHSKFRIVVVKYLLKKNDALRSNGVLDTEYQLDCFLISTVFFYKDLFNYEIDSNENDFPYTNIYYVIFSSSTLIIGRNSDESSQAFTRLERTT